jgi:hypothetical protein
MLLIGPDLTPDTRRRLIARLRLQAAQTAPNLGYRPKSGWVDRVKGHL